MRTHIEALALAKEVRERAHKGERPGLIADDLGLSRVYVDKLIRNERAYDKTYMPPDSTRELHSGIIDTQAKILRAIGLRGKVIAPYLGVATNRVYDLANSDRFNSRAQVEIELTEAITVGGKSFPVGKYGLSAYEPACKELLLMGNNRSKFVDPLQLAGKVSLEVATQL